MFKTLLLTAAAVLAIATPAKAATISVLLGNASNTETFSTSGASLNPNIDLTHLQSPVSFSNSAVMAANTSIPGYASIPTGSLYGGTYLAVFGGGNTTFNLSQFNASSFSLTWASIDSFNALSLTDTRGATYTITGADLLNYISTTTPGTTQANVVVSDPFGRFVTASLSSTSNSFEAANFGQSAVPLSPSAVFFGMALAGLGFLALRNRRSI